MNATDCDPTWADTQPTTRTPTTADLRQAELSDLREHGQNHNAHRVRLLTPLPFRVRLRLAVERRIDNTSFWLIGHHRMR